MAGIICIIQILPRMKPAGWGRIINIGAQAAIKGMPLSGPYCTSKIAVHALTKIIALENEGGITCNALVSGIIDAPYNRRQMLGADHGNWVGPGKIAKKIKELLLSDKNGALISL